MILDLLLPSGSISGFQGKPGISIACVDRPRAAGSMVIPISCSRTAKVNPQGWSDAETKSQHGGPFNLMCG